MNNLFSKCYELMLNKDFLPKLSHSNIYHYTSESGFNSILFNSNDSENITLWASRYDCLNDKSEGEIILEIYKETCKELLSDGKIDKTFYDIIVDLKPSDEVLFSFKPQQAKKSAMKKCERYIISFSTEEDSLPMWNYYSKGNYYEGFNIGFYSNEIIDMLQDVFADKFVNVWLGPVVYDKGKQKKVISDIILNLYNSDYANNEKFLIGFISQRLFDLNLVFKNEKYKHENEVRIVIDVAENENDINVKYRTYKGYTIPYIEIKISKEKVISVTLGPLPLRNTEIKKQKQIVKERLTNNDYFALVNSSEIPVRF